MARPLLAHPCVLRAVRQLNNVRLPRSYRLQEDRYRPSPKEIHAFIVKTLVRLVGAIADMNELGIKVIQRCIPAQVLQALNPRGNLVSVT
jgi:hypothetical protein